jgi:predicted O-methyltransferase YrrM
MVREGKQNAFLREFGRMAFDHASRDTAYAEVFDGAMSSYSSMQAALVLEALQRYDFSRFKHVCDIGGGHGYMACRLLAAHPHLTGTVLERESVIADTERLWAPKLGLSDRCHYMAGDMFHAAPAADAYVMKLILHDWNDDECVHVLENVREAAPAGGRIFVIEHIITGPDAPHFSKLFDVHMMCWGSGRERTEDEYAALLERAGWTYVNTWYPDSRVMGVVEGSKA